MPDSNVNTNIQRRPKMIETENLKKYFKHKISKNKETQRKQSFCSHPKL